MAWPGVKGSGGVAWRVAGAWRGGDAGGPSSPEAGSGGARGQLTPHPRAPHFLLPVCGEARWASSRSRTPGRSEQPGGHGAARAGAPGAAGAAGSAGPTLLRRAGPDPVAYAALGEAVSAPAGRLPRELLLLLRPLVHRRPLLLPPAGSVPAVSAPRARPGGAPGGCAGAGGEVGGALLSWFPR